MVAELELDSVIPPPDTIEEEHVRLIPYKPTIHAKVNSKREIVEMLLKARSIKRVSTVQPSTLNHYTTLIVRFQD